MVAATSGLLIDALEGKNGGRPPVWLMRQAGRYQPEYRALREKHSLRELFFTPELAARISMMPIERYGFDAAILFSDITSIAPALGLKLSFDEGPVIAPWREIAWPPRMELLEPIFEAVRLIKRESKVPLIGFCGGPFTVASYLIERHNGSEMPKTMSWMRGDPEGFARFLDRICELSILYLQRQVEAGADAVQVFDSWAHVLQGEEWNLYSQKYLQRIASSMDKPVIAFMRQSSLKAKEIERCGVAAVSADWFKPMAELRKEVSCCLQGNLDPDLLFQPNEKIKEEVKSLLQSMRSDPKFIVNLGHGIKQQTPLDAVQVLVDTVREYG